MKNENNYAKNVPQEIVKLVFLERAIYCDVRVKFKGPAHTVKARYKLKASEPYVQAKCHLGTFIFKKVDGEKDMARKRTGDIKRLLS